jgi:hypothetical protein
MNLPLVLDLAIGLIFVYLILSLLASEVQELITTLLQWRAEHLKKSIEVLFYGDNAEDQQDMNSVSNLATELYRHPLISALNQEAKGPIAHWFRRFSQTIGQLYRFIFRTRNIFGESKSGPSYIPSTTFSSAMLDDLGVKEASITQSLGRLDSFVDDKLKLVDRLLADLPDESDDNSLLQKIRDESQELAERLKAYRDDLECRRIQFPVAIKQTSDDLGRFVDGLEVVLKDTSTYEDKIKPRLPFVKQAIAVINSEPTISEVVETALREFEKKNKRLPKQLRDNLERLSNNAQSKAQSLSDGLNKLEDEVSDWFDRAMDRSSGVYRRNAKGIAVIIGFLVAVAANADTTYIVDRLSKDTLLRSTITQAAEQIASQPLESRAQTDEDGTLQSQSLEAIREAVDDSLDTLPFPIGWDEAVMKGQQGQNWVTPIFRWRVPFILRVIVGWLITGIAISMGSSFWYGILNKVIGIKNIGETNDQAASKNRGSSAGKSNND